MSRSHSYSKEKAWFGFITCMLLIVQYSSFIYAQETQFSMRSVLSYPFPNELTTSANRSEIAWAMNLEGKRNLYAASSPDFQSRKITPYEVDDGQELSNIKISDDGQWVVYIRGGDFGSNWDDEKPVNPRSDPFPPAVQIHSVPFSGGEPVTIGEGQDYVISPDSKTIAIVNNGQVWTAPIDGSSSPRKLFQTRGRQRELNYSPDGSKLAFVSNRGDHSFIGIYRGEGNTIQWADPSFDRDLSPRWSPDGSKMVFIRRPGSGGEPGLILKASHSPWSIVVFDLDSEKTRILWKAPETLRGSYPSTQGRTNLHWAKGHIVFLSYEDGWPHLYSIPESGGISKLLTPGSYMAEYISLNHTKDRLYFAGNTGPDPYDIDRRHIVGVNVDGSDFRVHTPGTELEWTPHQTGDGLYLVYISGGPKRPPLPAVMHLSSGRKMFLGTNLVPDNFPQKYLVTPSQVIFESKDGTPVHATLFRSGEFTGERPAVVYIHGGPPRQMLLGWHYSSYYSNAYAVNQYLANRGFVVLSVNYRLGIGYGYEFHRPEDGGWRGASEYQDILAAGEWLADQEYIDHTRIGVYGGSYGGYLTAMALARDSDLFAAGVDIHGVHDRTEGRARSFVMPDQYEKSMDASYALEVAWASSPVADMDTWRSPVLVIHADDDRNVRFSQSTDLVQRLRKQGVDTETMVIVDDTHHFMMHANQLKVNEAVADFFERRMK